MSGKRESQRSAKAKQAELERRLREITNQEKSVKERIHKLEAGIVSAPSLMSGQRLRNWSTVPADEESPPHFRSRRSQTRWQRQRLHQARSRQAMTALFLIALLAFFAWWFYHQLKANGLLG